MTSELAIELYGSGKAHGGAACLLYRASIEHAADEGIEDPVTYTFNGPNSLSIHYLLGLGLELMLKALIVAFDPDADAKFLRNEIGHDLIKALDEAEHRGFKSEAQHLRAIVELLSGPYCQHAFRYERPDQMPLPGDFDEVVDMLTVLEGEVASTIQRDAVDGSTDR